MPTIKQIWEVPGIAAIEYLHDKPEHYGVSHFWFCVYCREEYANARIEGRVWRAIGGCCSNCKGNRWLVPGSLECIFTIGWHVPEAILRYQLDRELAFLDHPEHPYNEKEEM